MRVGIQNAEYGCAGGINTYSTRLERYLNILNNVEVSTFISKPVDDYDVICIQYEPGITPPQFVESLIKKYNKPFVMTVHHNRGIESLYNIVNGFVFHSSDQIINTPYNYTIIPHPCLVFDNIDKLKIRKDLGLPLDKKIIGTAGFIFGTGKNLPETVRYILKNMNDDEFLYLSTSNWKHGDGGSRYDIMSEVKKLGKENQFRIDTDFVDDESLNARLQACDLLYAYCGVGPNDTGSQSGIAADMYGSRRKLIVKKSAHYSHIAQQDKVKVGRENPKEFAEDVIDLLRNGDLDDVQNPTQSSWDNQIIKYSYYLRKVKEMF
jgi:hypothetical protein